MGLGRYAVGVLTLLLILVPPVLAGTTLVHRSLPTLSGAPKALACLAVGLAQLLLGAHVVGAVGGFAALPLVGIGLAGAAVAIAFVPHRTADQRRAGVPSAPRGQMAVMAVVLACLAAQWSTRVLDMYGHGVSDYDSLHYHLPQAARFVQLGRLTELHFASADGVPNMFHPADSEVIHAVGMLAFGNDVLTFLVNVGFAVLGLLAAWCIGRPWGQGPASVVGFAAVLAMPVTALSAGSALGDVPSYACLLASLAFLVQPDQSWRARGALAAVAAGLALSMKLTMLAPIAALTLGVIVATARSERLRAAAQWLGILGLVGGFWFLRNWAAAGSPLPSLRLGIFPSPRLSTVERYGFSVARYLDDPDVVRTWLVPGMTAGMSPAWPLIVATVILVVVLAARLRHQPELPAIAFAIVVTTLAYLVTPTSAFGLPDQPFLFAVNVRYVFPAVVAALALLPVVVAIRADRWQPGATGLVLLLFVGSQVSVHTSFPGLAPYIAASAPGHRWAALGVGASVLAVSLAVTRGVPRLTPSRARAVAVAAGVAVIVAGSAVHSGYLARRYATDARASLLTEVGPVRVAVGGFDTQYPLYGEALSNHVQYIGRRTPHGGFDHVTSCAEWRRAVRAGAYDYVVVPQEPPFSGPEVSWTSDWPAASEVLSEDGLLVFALDLAGGRDRCG